VFIALWPNHDPLKLPLMENGDEGNSSRPSALNNPADLCAFFHLLRGCQERHVQRIGDFLRFIEDADIPYEQALKYLPPAGGVSALRLAWTAIPAAGSRSESSEPSSEPFATLSTSFDKSEASASDPEELAEAEAKVRVPLDSGTGRSDPPESDPWQTGGNTRRK
jgi:hypothetical protein